MALGTALLTLLEVFGFCLGFASLGNVLLRFLRLDMESDAEQLLVAIATGLVASEMLLFFVEVTQHIRLGCFAIVTLLGGFLVWQWKQVWNRFTGVFRKVVPQSLLGKILLTLIVAVVFVEFLSARAPLTGSDALQYHFAVQKQILKQGFHPTFANSHSFLCGQHHLLILLGLALDSEPLALGFILLGGILTAASFACLASRWTRPVIGIGFTLLFLLTPVIFWQVMSSGSPDIHMGFLACTAVIVLVQQNSLGIGRQALLAGFLTGGIAGAKYTGYFVAAALAIAVTFEFRSAISTLLFLAGSLASGIWPYLRNFVWTGSPVFPFLATRFSRELAAPHALAALFADTGTSASHSVAQVLPFIFFAGVRLSGAGLWDFFGPTVLILAPLIALALKWERQWRVVVLVWVASSLAIGFSSGSARFLLPIFPLALCCAAAGFDFCVRERWAFVRWLIGAMLIFTGLGCAAGLAMYSQSRLRVALGLEDRTSYLRDRGPEYQIAETINNVLRSQENHGSALVFFRHLYYLDVPYVNGDPDTSFEVDPEKLRSRGDWKAFLEKENIAFVVRSPRYPASIEGPLEEMERVGELTPIAHVEVQIFQGMRVNQIRTTIPVVVFKVNR